MVRRNLVDPLLTASIYCSGHVDDLLYHGIRPFWKRFRRHDPEKLCCLWLARYVRCGEHLKVRLHGPAQLRDMMQSELGDAVERFFSTLGPVSEEERPLYGHLLPIDLEDEADSVYPDRTLLWTHYRRAPSMMGRELLPDDIELDALFTRCISCGTEIVLDSFVPGASGRFEHRMRASLITKFFVSGLSTLPLSRARTLDYLIHHRDWLIHATESDLAGMIAVFDRYVARRHAAVRLLREAFESRSSRLAAREVDHFTAWQRSFAELFARALSAANDGRYDESPRVRAPLFRALHGLSNQVRVGIYNEALTCHLLHLALAREPTDDSPLAKPALGAGFAMAGYDDRGLS